MRVNMIYSALLQQYGVISSQAGVDQTLQSTRRRFFSSEEHTLYQACNALPTPYRQLESSQKDQHSNRLQTENLRLKRYGGRFVLVHNRPSHTAGKHSNSPLPQ